MTARRQVRLVHVHRRRHRPAGLKECPVASRQVTDVREVLRRGRRRDRERPEPPAGSVQVQPVRRDHHAGARGAPLPLRAVEGGGTDPVLTDEALRRRLLLRAVAGGDRRGDLRVVGGLLRRVPGRRRLVAVHREPTVQPLGELGIRLPVRGVRRDLGHEHREHDHRQHDDQQEEKRQATAKAHMCPGAIHGFPHLRSANLRVSLPPVRTHHCVPPGAIAQLGERLVRNQEVGGSSPPSSTSRSPCCGGGFLFP